MKNKQRVIFIALFLILAGVLLFRYLHTNEDFSKIRSKENNTAEAIVLNGPNLYEVGKENFKSGYYNVEAKVHIETTMFKLGEGQQIVSLRFNDANFIELDEGITLKLTPSKFDPILFKNSVAILANTTGYFQCGTELEEGRYAISVIIENDDAQFLIQKTDLDSNILQSKTVSNKDVFNMTLEKGDILQLLNMDTTLGDFMIKIEKR